MRLFTGQARQRRDMQMHLRSSSERRSQKSRCGAAESGPDLAHVQTHPHERTNWLECQQPQAVERRAFVLELHRPVPRAGAAHGATVAKGRRAALPKRHPVTAKV